MKLLIWTCLLLTAAAVCTANQTGVSVENGLLESRVNRIERREAIREKLQIVRPALKANFISTDDIREIIFNALEGIYLYDYISSGRSCVDALDTY